jgi:hypothetical protein
VKRADLAAAAALLVLAVLAFAPVLPGGRVMFERDIGSVWYPQIASIVRVAAEHSWPTWNPYFSFGAPIWEDPTYQVAYPPAWLNLLLTPDICHKLLAVGHTWLAGLGFYGLLLVLGMARPAALVGGALWSLSGPFLSLVNLGGHHHASAAWASWVLLALARLCLAPSVGRALALAGALAALAVAGSPDMMMLTAIVGGVVVLALRDPRRLAERRFLGALSLAVVAGASASAVQWLPTAAYVARMSTRLHFQARDTLYWSVHPLSLLDTLVPALMADLPLNAAARAAFFESRAPFLQSLYLGAAASTLVVLVLWLGRRRLTIACALLFGVLSFVSLGRHAPGLLWLLQASPLSVPFRYPVKAAVGGAMAWAILAAAGVEVWRRVWTPVERRHARALAGVLAVVGAAAAGAVWSGAVASRLAPMLEPVFAAEGTHVAARRLVVFAVLSVASAALLFWRASRADAPAASVVLTCLLVIADITAAGRDVNVAAPASLLASRPDVVAHIPNLADAVRVQSMGVGPRGIELATQGPPGWEPQWTQTLGTFETLIAPTGARWRLAGAFDGDLTGLTPAPLPLMSALAVGEDPRVRRRLLALGAVEYVVGVFPQGVDVDALGWAPVAAVPSVYEAPVRLFRVVDRVPRAYVVGRARVVEDTDQALRQMLSDAFDPHAEVLLGSGRALPPAGTFEGTARIADRAADRVSIDVEASHDGYLVLVESYAQSWRATVDGAPAAVLRANAAFRAVAVPAGRHRVEMAYRPRMVAWGLALCASTLAGALAWWLCCGRRKAA